MKRIAAAFVLLAAGLSAAAQPPGAFADNPIVYFVITDRFLDGDPSNNRSYGRAPDGRQEIGAWHGGDFAGLTKKLEEGWFRALGVNAIWITAPYEQIHGWVVGGNKEFEHYAYHGYFALDPTVLDKNIGSEDELRRFVDAAHAQKIRVLFDVVMNHPGYGDLRTLAEYQVGVVWDGWEKATPQNYHGFIDYNSPKWANWWGSDWIRAGLRGYTEGNRGDDLTMQLAFLPDFRTEQARPVDLPPILKAKPDTRAKAIPGATVRDYLVTWLSQWVRDYGIDGFRCDTVKHVEPGSWLALKKAGTEALAAWKAANPGAKIDDAPFWMTGEDWGHGIARTKRFDGGFDNMINFDFQERVQGAVGKALDAAALDKLYAEYAKTLAAPATHNVLSYLSSHDTRLFDRARLVDAGSALLLAPGGVQIFYGDETGRPGGPAPSSDPQQATRSDMNWTAIDARLLAHWRRLGRFRHDHVALARGVHRQLAASPYTFSRIDAGSGDRVVVAWDLKGEVRIPVGDTFADGSRVRDAYTGRTAVVREGAVSLSAERWVLLEAVRP